MIVYKLGERPEYSEVALNWEKYADYLEKQRDELIELVRAFESYLEDDSRSPRRREVCLVEVRAVLAKLVQP